MMGSAMLVRQSGYRPAGALRNGFILVSGHFFEDGPEIAMAAIAHSYGGITAQAGAFRAAQGRSAKILSEFFRGHFGKP